MIPDDSFLFLRAQPSAILTSEWLAIRGNYPEVATFHQISEGWWKSIFIKLSLGELDFHSDGGSIWFYLNLGRGVQSAPVFYGLETRWCQILGMCDQGTAALGKLFKEGWGNISTRSVNPQRFVLVTPVCPDILTYLYHDCHVDAILMFYFFCGC